jgi:hypothetical protein
MHPMRIFEFVIGVRGEAACGRPDQRGVLQGAYCLGAFLGHYTQMLQKGLNSPILSSTELPAFTNDL